MATLTRHYLIFGRVQGVGFRAYTLRVADQLDLRGWVRNRPDGAVETVAQGTSASLERFTEMLKQGPKLSEVTEVQAKDIQENQNFIGFAIE